MMCDGDENPNRSDFGDKDSSASLNWASLNMDAHVRGGLSDSESARLRKCLERDPKLREEFDFVGQIVEAYDLSEECAKERWGSPSSSFSDRVMEQVLSEENEFAKGPLSVLGRGNHAGMPTSVIRFGWMKRAVAAALVISALGFLITKGGRQDDFDSGPSLLAGGSIEDALDSLPKEAAASQTEFSQTVSPQTVSPQTVSPQTVSFETGLYRVGGKPATVSLPADHPLIRLESLLAQTDVVDFEDVPVSDDLEFVPFPVSRGSMTRDSSFHDGMTGVHFASL